jgi:hypothetical protein
VEPDIDISTDKTLPPTMVSKMGKYPQQILLKAKPLIAVGQIKLVNGKLTMQNGLQSQVREGL